MIVWKYFFSLSPHPHNPMRWVDAIMRNDIWVSAYFCLRLMTAKGDDIRNIARQYICIHIWVGTSTNSATKKNDTRIQENSPKCNYSFRNDVVHFAFILLFDYFSKCFIVAKIAFILFKMFYEMFAAEKLGNMDIGLGLSLCVYVCVKNCAINTVIFSRFEHRQSFCCVCFLHLLVLCLCGRFFICSRHNHTTATAI